MLFLKHSFGILALHVLLHAQQAFAEEDHTLFETEFRLMIMTGDPEHDMVTVEGEDGTMWPGNTEDDDKAGKPWYPGVKARDANGNWRMSYMAWSRPSEKERTMWHHHKDQKPDSGRKCTIRLNHDPKVPRLDWYTWADWGLDVDSTINEFQHLERLYIVCEGSVAP